MGVTLAIVNPVAGGGRAARLWSALALGTEYVMTERAGGAQVLARQALDRGTGRVIAVGGDGTVS